MAELSQLVDELGERIRSLLTKRRGITEEETKNFLITPMLRGLDWDMENPDEVSFEYRHTPQDNPVDYALFVASQPVLFVEAKSLGRDIGEHKWRAQAVAYANAAGVEWCVLTDGNFWHVFRSHAPGELKQKLVFETWLHSPEGATPPRGPVEVLSLLAKDALDKIGTVARAVQAVRIGEEALVALVKDKDASLVRLLRKRTELSKSDIVSFLDQVTINVEPSFVETVRPKPGPKPKRTKQERTLARRKADTIVVSAREENLRRVFLGENRWHAIRLNKRKVADNSIRYIAAYQVRPVSAITHYAEVESIKPWQNTGKWVVNFKGPARSIGPIPYDPSGRKKPPQNPQFARFELLRTAKTLDDVFR